MVNKSWGRLQPSPSNALRRAHQHPHSEPWRIRRRKCPRLYSTRVLRRTCALRRKRSYVESFAGRRCRKRNSARSAPRWSLRRCRRDWIISMGVESTFALSTARTHASVSPRRSLYPLGCSGNSPPHCRVKRRTTPTTTTTTPMMSTITTSTTTTTTTTSTPPTPPPTPPTPCAPACAPGSSTRPWRGRWCVILCALVLPSQENRWMNSLKISMIRRIATTTSQRSAQKSSTLSTLV